MYSNMCITSVSPLKKKKESFLIKTASLDQVVQHLDKLTKKAKKLGVPAPRLIVGEEKLVEQYPEWLSSKDPWFESYTNITVEWEEIKLPGGWQFAATVEVYKEGENMICGLPALSDRLPTSLRTEKLSCQHCNTNRYRKKHIILLSESGEVKIVGTSCLKDFLAHDVETKLWMLEAELGLRNEIQNISSGFKVVEPPLKTVIGQMFAILRKHPWTSKGSSDVLAGKTPTYQDVLNQLFNPRIEKKDRINITDADLIRAEQVLERWAKKCPTITPNSNEIEWRKKLLYERGIVEPKRIALAVGLAYGEWVAIGREIEERELAQVRAQQGYFGVVGEFGIFDLKILRSISVPGYSGASELVIGILNNTPHQFTWFNAGKAWYEFGQVYKVKAFVKGHEESDRFGKQTLLNRVKKL